MRDKVWEYLITSEKDRENIWENCDFVFDTSVLLNLYRYSAVSRNAMLSVMNSLKDRLWLPYYIAYDFAKRRCDVIYETVEKYYSIRRTMETHINQYSSEMNMTEKEPVIQEMKNYVDSWIDKLMQKNVLVMQPDKDKILDYILEIYDEKVGDAWSEQQFAEMIEAGKKRYAELVPPGYCSDSQDKPLPDDKRYGDYILWQQMMMHATKEYKNIIFITHRESEDWWQISKGGIIGPRAELKKEFRDVTGENFFMYSTGGFLKQCIKYKNYQIDPCAVSEIAMIKE